MKLFKVSAVTLSCLFALSSCVLPKYPQKPETRWFKDGTTYEDARTKLAKCTYDVGMNKVDPTEKDSLITSCMGADGYRWGIPPEELKEWEDKVKAYNSGRY